ncbi:MAG: metallophosphoesterase family protein [Dictyoglomus thermophilum]|uniref:Metallophosphoesterase n=1 Tax=Dictyoglomus thermophilum TaxID=14 RepID=A0A7V3ZJ78_DICTH
MRVGVISDIHSNLPALERVYKNLEGEVDEIYFLGDIVGYGPFPNECVDYLKKFSFKVIGNHDAAVAGIRSYDDFNEYARFAIDWTKENISIENIEKLKNLPQKKELEDLYLVHGSLRDPLDEYLINYYSVFANFELMEKNIAFFGHTHLAGVFIFSEKEKEIYYVSFINEGKLKLERGHKYLINPGSVGQPRDGNWKSSYVVYDTRSKVIEFYRVEYNLESLQKYMKMLGFPRHLWERLQYGR